MDIEAQVMLAKGLIRFATSKRGTKTTSHHAAGDAKFVGDSDDEQCQQRPFFALATNDVQGIV